MPATRNIAPTRRPKPVEDKITFIIPTAGIAYRLKYLGSRSFLKIDDNYTLIEHQLHTIYGAYPKAEVFIVVGFESHKYLFLREQYPIRLINNELYEKTNVVHSIGLALQANTNKKVVLIYGDVYFNHPSINNIHIDNSKLVIDTKQQINNEKIGVVINKNKVTNLAFGLANKWAQIAYFTGNELALLERVAFDNKKRGWFGHEALNYIIGKGGRFNIFESPDIQIKEIVKQ